MSKNNTKKNYPLILVFYMDRALFGTELMVQIVDSINTTLASKESNIMGFFVPTDGEERIECINPMLVHEPDMEKINNLVQDLAKNFDIGQGADKGKDDPEYEIEVDNDEE